MIEKIIVLEEIKHEEKKMHKAFGVTLKRLSECWRELILSIDQWCPEFEKEFKLTEREVVELAEMGGAITQTASRFFKGKDRTQVSLKEVLKIIMILAAYICTVEKEKGKAFKDYLVRYNMSAAS